MQFQLTFFRHGRFRHIRNYAPGTARFAPAYYPFIATDNRDYFSKLSRQIIQEGIVSLPHLPHDEGHQDEEALSAIKFPENECMSCGNGLPLQWHFQSPLPYCLAPLSR
jgi:hypothetical protein